jgi:hypothetical protein
LSALRYFRFFLFFFISCSFRYSCLSVFKAAPAPAAADETTAKKKSSKGKKGKTTVVKGEGENKENVEGEQKKEKKPVKKSIPSWATLSDEAKKRLAHSKVNQCCLQTVL